MKHFTWLAAVGGCCVAAAIYWTNRGKDLAPIAVTEVRPSAVPAPRPFVRPAVREANEPILVLPELEEAPPPASAVEPSAPLPRVKSPDIGIRPDVRDGRLWMPYAPEDYDLSATRKLEWVKLSIRDTANASRVDGFEETEEPPLLEKRAK